MDHHIPMLYRPHDTRYAFHHDNSLYEYVEDVSTFQVTLVDEHTTERVTYRVAEVRRGFPLRELMYTFVEQVGVRIENLEFRYKGALVPLWATPLSLGMANKNNNVISVSVVTSPYERRIEMLTRLNRMGKVTIGAGPHQGAMFGSELLPRMLDFASLETLVNASQVCRHWFHVTQRFAVLLQLQDGDSDAWQEQQKYPLLLHDGCRHSFNLALCEARGRISEKNWRTATMQKETTDNHGFGFCKAAGCRTIKTVSMESISRALDSKWEALDSAKTEFMRQVKDALPTSANGLVTSPKPERDTLQQEIPPFGDAGDGFVAEARDRQYRNCAVELYRRYFSPDMYYIFPLIVNKQAAVGLDFRSATTNLIFGSASLPVQQTTQRQAIRPYGRRNLQGSLSEAGGGLPVPLGSVSWRIHDASEVAAKGAGVDVECLERDFTLRGWKPQLVLEVLFVAVWENDRGGEYGSSLVTSLESRALSYAKAKGHKSALMYVEIGFEQPKAKKFWGNNGFLPVVNCTNAGSRHGSNHPGTPLAWEVLELQDWELGFIDRRCLRFKDTEQYAKKVLVG